MDFLQTLEPTPKFFFPRTRRFWGQEFMIMYDEHISGRQVFNLVRATSEKVWVHLFRETCASDIVRADASIIAAYKVQRRLDLERVETGFRYVRRFAADIISRQLSKETKNNV